MLSPEPLGLSAVVETERKEETLRLKGNTFSFLLIKYYKENLLSLTWKPLSSANGNSVGLVIETLTVT